MSKLKVYSHKDFLKYKTKLMRKAKLFSSKNLLNHLDLKVGDILFLDGRPCIVKKDAYDSYLHTEYVLHQVSFNKVIPIRRFLDMSFTTESGKKKLFSSNDLLKILKLKVNDKIKIVYPECFNLDTIFTLEYTPEDRASEYNFVSRGFNLFGEEIIISSFPLRHLIDIPFIKLRKGGE
jgi:hypothetical protein